MVPSLAPPSNDCGNFLQCHDCGNSACSSCIEESACADCGAPTCPNCAAHFDM